MDTYILCHLEGYYYVALKAYSSMQVMLQEKGTNQVQVIGVFVGPDNGRYWVDFDPSMVTKWLWKNMDKPTSVELAMKSTPRVKPLTP